MQKYVNYITNKAISASTPSIRLISPNSVGATFRKPTLDSTDLRGYISNGSAYFTAKHTMKAESLIRIGVYPGGTTFSWGPKTHTFHHNPSMQ